MGVPARLSEQRRHMALSAGGFALEEGFSPPDGLSIEATLRRLRGRNRQLIKLQCAELRCHHIVGAPLIAKTCFGSNRILIWIIEALVKKVPLSIQFKVADVSVPVGDCSPATSP